MCPIRSRRSSIRSICASSSYCPISLNRSSSASDTPLPYAGGVLGDVVGDREGAEGPGTFSMHASFWDHLPIEAGELFQEPDVLQQRRPEGFCGHGVPVVGMLRTCGNLTEYLETLVRKLHAGLPAGGLELLKPAPNRVTGSIDG